MKKTKLVILGSILAVAIIVFVALYVNGLVVSDKANVLWVSHTEYWPSATGWNPNDQVATIVRLTDYKGAPFSVDSCIVTILNPDKTAYVTGASMSASGIAGNWYRYDPLPPIVGTYEQEVTCTWATGSKNIKTSQSFHINEALGFLRNLSVDISDAHINLTNINGTISALIASTNETIILRLDNLDGNLTSWIGEVNASLSTQLEAARASMSTELTSVNATINTRIGAAETVITTQIDDVNTSISNLVTTLNNDIKSYLVDFLPGMNQTLTNVFNDTDWLVSNAMNQQDKAAIDARFSAIDANLTLIDQFCSTAETSSSRLCTDLDSIQANLSVMRNEQTQYYNDLNVTVTNTWDLLSGDITTNINTALAELGIIKGQTTQINQTVEDIREDQTSRVYANVVS